MARHKFPKAPPMPERFPVKAHTRSKRMPPPPPPPPSGFGLAQPPGAEAPEEPEGEI